MSKYNRMIRLLTVNKIFKMLILLKNNLVIISADVQINCKSIFDLFVNFI